MIDDQAQIATAPLTPDRWEDIRKVFRRGGDASSCWCMYFKLETKHFDELKNPGQREAFRRIVETGTPPPGVIAYVCDEPAGWCACEPRSNYPRLCKSRVAKPVQPSDADNPNLWSITCFVVVQQFRGRGLMGVLIDAACEHARLHGATAVEAYPRTRASRPTHNTAYPGIDDVFLARGFHVVADRPPTRVLVRRSMVP